MKGYDNINHVRSTKGCLACIFWHGDAEILQLYNVTVVDRDKELLSVGEKQLYLFREGECPHKTGGAGIPSREHRQIMKKILSKCKQQLLFLR